MSSESLLEANPHNKTISVEPIAMGSVGSTNEDASHTPNSATSAQSPGQGELPSKAATRPLRRSHYQDGLSQNRFIAFKRFILVDIDLPKTLLNAGISSYMVFTLKTLWKFLLMYRSQPHTAAVGFIVPSVATYAFVQRYSSARTGNAHSVQMGFPQAAVDVTILAGTFICTFILWSLVSFAGDLGALLFLAFSFGTRYLPSSL